MGVDDRGRHLGGPAGAGIQGSCRIRRSISDRSGHRFLGQDEVGRRVPRPTQKRAMGSGDPGDSVNAYGALDRESCTANGAGCTPRTVNVRNDRDHKATTAIAKSAGQVVEETLNVSGMVRNRRLARAIVDGGLEPLLAVGGWDALGVEGSCSRRGCSCPVAPCRRPV